MNEQENKFSSLFIVIEGGDGAGKTTQAELLKNWLTKQGRDVVLTREPGGTQLGAQIREIILHGEYINPKTEALLYAADRAHHVNTKIRPALENGQIVISDRYIDSSIAYQGYGRNLRERVIEDLNVWATDNLKPDLVIVLDIIPEENMIKGKKDNIENQPIEFHKQVRNFFIRKAKNSSNYVVIDAKDTIESIHAKIISIVQERLK
ncbi:dTMP kinase [Actinomyces sp. zg-332]|uniref:dTMP kinase n=1 Tax=Actinomyces sp. zg-332 TaxID=2708340 RepID=UPI0014215DCD|nr:dTMP kinase [Actinomyces sp. zg-332]